MDILNIYLLCEKKNNGRTAKYENNNPVYFIVISCVNIFVVPKIQLSMRRKNRTNFAGDEMKIVIARGQSLLLQSLSLFPPSR